MRQLIRAARLATLLVLFCIGSAAADDVRELSWEDLIPAEDFPQVNEPVYLFEDEGGDD